MVESQKRKASDRLFLYIGAREERFQYILDRSRARVVAEAEEPNTWIYYVTAEYLPSVGKRSCSHRPFSSSPSSPVSSTSPTDEQDILSSVPNRHSFPSLYGRYLSTGFLSLITSDVSHTPRLFRSRRQRHHFLHIVQLTILEVFTLAT